jgi:hypothetical protein
MAIWQYRLALIPEGALLSKYDVLPLKISMELAEEFGWWSDNQPQSGFEQQIDLILPQMDSWSTSMRMWGHKHRTMLTSFTQMRTRARQNKSLFASILARSRQNWCAEYACWQGIWDAYC